VKAELIPDTKTDVIINPVEVENPTTGEIKTIETPVENVRDVLPIIIETPAGGSGGGGGSSDYFERGGGYGREQVFERDMNQRENIQ
jgi:hypothetical protein